MIEPRIKYTKTSDGVRIAMAVAGQGPPLVYIVNPAASHVGLEWEIPPHSVVLKRLASTRTVIRLNTRGTGLSDRHVEDMSFEGHIRDLEAVVQHLGLGTFALLGEQHGALLTMAYSALHPDRVSRLILADAFARPADVLATPRFQALMGLVGDWEMWSENVANVTFGYGREEAKEFGKLVRAGLDPETLARLVQMSATLDMTDILADMTMPTLVLFHDEMVWVPMEATRDLVAGLPNVRMRAVHGKYAADLDGYADAIEAFLSEDKPASGGDLAPHDVHTILFTDVEGSTALTQRLGDERARELLREHERIVREALRSHGGSEVKTMGDGFMASFTSATRAIECAIAIQRAFEAEPAADERIQVRIGLNAGEPIAEHEDLFGTAVNEAARITAAAEGGEILVANVIRELTKGKGFLFADRGEFVAKGIEEPVRVYEVRWRE